MGEFQESPDGTIAALRQILRDSVDKDGRLCYTSNKERQEQRANALANMLLPTLSVVQLKRLQYLIRKEIKSRPTENIGRPRMSAHEIEKQQRIASAIDDGFRKVGLTREEADKIIEMATGVGKKTARYRKIPENSKK